MKQPIIIYRSILFFACIIIRLAVSGQIDLTNEKGIEKLTPKEFSIPVSPLFDLMGVAPSQVVRTSEIKDFKVDWSFKSWKLNPNLAIEAQPVWELFYNRKKLDKYQRAGYFQRALASLDLSVGTVQSENNDRRIGGALKMNIYRQRDPLLMKTAYDGIEQAYEEELKQLREKEKSILLALDSLTRPSDIQKKRQELKENDVQMATFYSRRNTAIQQKAAEFIQENWNSAYLDIAWGKIYTYSTDSAESLRKLKLNRNTGHGFWINAGKGIGKRGLVSALIRSTFYEEQLTFSITDTTTGELTNQEAVASNKLFTLGINFRYGGPVYNFFAEFIYERKGITKPIDALRKVFTVPDGKVVDAGTVKWESTPPFTINIGGDWRVSRNVILNYGIRCILDKHFKTTSFIPVASISCMMR